MREGGTAQALSTTRDLLRRETESPSKASNTSSMKSWDAAGISESRFLRFSGGDVVVGGRGGRRVVRGGSGGLLVVLKVVFKVVLKVVLLGS